MQQHLMGGRVTVHRNLHYKIEETRSKAIEIRKGHLELQHNMILKTIIGKIQKNLIPL
jgi:hypothetical protein